MDEAEARRIVGLLLEDLCDRGGFGNLWDEIDAATQAECLRAWVDLVRSGPENVPMTFCAVQVTKAREASS